MRRQTCHLCGINAASFAGVPTADDDDKPDHTRRSAPGPPSPGPIDYALSLHYVYIETESGSVVVCAYIYIYIYIYIHAKSPVGRALAVDCCGARRCMYRPSLLPVSSALKCLWVWREGAPHRNVWVGMKIADGAARRRWWRRCIKNFRLTWKRPRGMSAFFFFS